MPAQKPFNQFSLFKSLPLTSFEWANVMGDTPCFVTQKSRTSSLTWQQLNEAMEEQMNGITGVEAVFFFFFLSTLHIQMPALPFIVCHMPHEECPPDFLLAAGNSIRNFYVFSSQTEVNKSDGWMKVRWPRVLNWLQLKTRKAKSTWNTGEKNKYTILVRVWLVFKL